MSEPTFESLLSDETKRAAFEAVVALASLGRSDAQEAAIRLAEMLMTPLFIMEGNPS